jgi:drug/metabolite transporter (DMT)-like permease
VAIPEGGPLTTSSHVSTTPDGTTRRGLGSGVVVALLTVYLVWGSTYLAIRVVVTSHLPALLSMGVRFLLAGLLLAAGVRLRAGRGALAASRRQLGTAAVVGVLLLCGGNGFVALAERDVPSGLTALLVSTTPLWIVVLGLAAGERPRLLSVAGTLVGFAGTAVLARPGGSGVGAWQGIALILTGTACWAIGSLYSRRNDSPRNPFAAAAYQMLFGGAALVLGGLVLGEAADVDLGAVPASGWWALVYLVTIGSLVAYTAYFWLLANAPLQLVTTYAYVNPVVAVALGWALLAEPVTAQVVVGGALAVAGVVIVISSERGGAH